MNTQNTSYTKNKLKRMTDTFMLGSRRIERPIIPIQKQRTITKRIILLLLLFHESECLTRRCVSNENETKNHLVWLFLLLMTTQLFVTNHKTTRKIPIDRVIIVDSGNGSQQHGNILYVQTNTYHQWQENNNLCAMKYEGGTYDKCISENLEM